MPLRDVTAYFTASTVVRRVRDAADLRPARWMMCERALEGGSPASVECWFGVTGNRSICSRGMIRSGSLEDAQIR